MLLACSTIFFLIACVCVSIGTSAVMVNLYMEGKLALNEDFVHEGIVGTQFIGKLVEETTVRTK